jgi:hypothetical protein
VPNCGVSCTHCSAVQICSDSIPSCGQRRPSQVWSPMSFGSSRPGRISRILGQQGRTWWQPATVGVKKKPKRSGQPPYSSTKAERALASVAHVGNAKPDFRAAISGQCEEVVGAFRDGSGGISSIQDFLTPPKGRGSLSFSNVAAATTAEAASEIERITRSPPLDSHGFFGLTNCKLELDCAS